MNEESPGHHADLAAGFAAGSWLGGYRLEEQVGAGGMAVVFRARDERLDRLVALKIMTPVMGSDEMFRQRFIRESRAAAAVDDPHIIPVYEAGEVGHVLFIAMRFVRGGDVRSLLRREGPLPPERVASIISPVASALDAAHVAGLVHRDVKPANILLDRRPGRPDHVYLSDFGLSKSAEVSLGLTAAGQFLGTPDYTAPEQIEGLPVDGRTDQYALACAVFELLTGQAPFHRSESFAAIWAHLNKAPPSLAERRPELPPAADLVMAKALAKAQADRYQTCWEFADALRDALGLPPYHLGSASDPGLSRAGSNPSREALRGSGPSPAPVAPPPSAPAGAGRGADPGAGREGPPPGEDTEASEVYAARSPAAERDQGRPAEDRQDSTPDDQPTDPGLQAIPSSPAAAASVREEAPSPAPQGQQPGPPARLDTGPAEPVSGPAEPDSGPADLDASAGDGDNAPAASAAGRDGTPGGPAARPASLNNGQADREGAPAASAAGRDGTPSGAAARPADLNNGQADLEGARPASPAGRDGTPSAPAAGQAGRDGTPSAPADLNNGQADLDSAPPAGRAGQPPVTPAQQPAVTPASRISAPPQEPPAGPPRTPAGQGDAPAGRPAATPAGQAGTPAGPAVEPPHVPPRQPAPPRNWPGAPRPQPSTHRQRPGTTRGRPGPTPERAGRPTRPPAPFGRPAPPRKAASTTAPPASRARRGRRHRSAAYLALVGAGVLLAAAAVVVLTTVVTTKFLGPGDNHRPTVPSAYTHRVFGRPQTGILSSVAFSPDGKTLSAGATGDPKAGPKRGGQAEGTTYLWDVKTGTQRTLSPGGGAEAFSPNGSILAAAGGPGNNTTYLWEVAAQHTIAVLSDHHDSSVEGVAFSASGKTLAVNDANGTVYVWALGRGDEVPAGYHPEVLALPGGVKSDAIAFSRRGATLAMGGADGQVYLWSEAAGTVTRTLKPAGNPAAVTSVAFSPNGQALAAGENGGVTYVWDLASRTRLSLPDPDGSAIESVAFSPDSKWVATGAANGKTYLWHLPATKPFATLTNPKGPDSRSSSEDHGTAVFSVAFSPGGTSLATTDPDGRVFLWKVR